MKVYPDQLTKSQAQAISYCITPRLSTASDATNKELFDLDAEMTLIEAILSCG